MKIVDFSKEYLTGLKMIIDTVDHKLIAGVCDALVLALEEGSQIIAFGNGGSAATASHFCCDLNKGVSYNREKKFKALCLSESISTIMAYSNDVSYEDIFIEQMKNFLQPRDLIVAFSGSGNSENVIKACSFAKQSGNKVIGFCGYDGGRLKNIADISIQANVEDMQKAEDIHLIVTHIIMQYLCKFTD